MGAVQYPYLFSIDLEDTRFMIPNGTQYREYVPQLTAQYLTFLKRYDAQITFFVVGDIARAYPDLIKKILDDGHEIACHTDTHIPLYKQTPETFRIDLEKNRESLMNAGATEITGFRAPCFSLTKDTAWTYGILKELGFTYSSSVLPQKNPLAGWEEFGTEPRMIEEILEMPISVLKSLKVPIAGGIYFRMLPAFILKKIFENQLQKKQLLGYFHPYDIDYQQERYNYPELGKNIIFQSLMYYGRSGMLKKLVYLFDSLSLTTTTYIEASKMIKVGEKI